MLDTKKEFILSDTQSEINKLTKEDRIPFTQIPNGLIEDVSLSAKAKGIYIYLMSKPSGWQFWMTDIIAHFTDKESSIRSGLVELEESGYISRERIREDGKLKGYNYKIRFSRLENLDLNFKARNSRLENQVHSNINLNNNENNNKEETNKHTSLMKSNINATNATNETAVSEQVGEVDIAGGSKSPNYVIKADSYNIYRAHVAGYNAHLSPEVTKVIDGFLERGVALCEQDKRKTPKSLFEEACKITAKRVGIKEPLKFIDGIYKRWEEFGLNGKNKSIPDWVDGDDPFAHIYK